jgi:predicted nuclease of predicted toxin-antitoxin system
VRLLVDAQLPDRLADCLAPLGHDVVHTIELADGNRTTDAEIIRIADRDERTVVTKDHDFLDGHLLNNVPQRLLLVTTGNIRNDDLIALIEAVEPLLVEAFEHSAFVEVNRGAVIGH